MTINWGIIGLGSIANTFANDLKRVNHANLLAVASRSLSKAIAFKEKHKANLAYGTYKELVLNSAIDIVYIATPHVFHYENAKICLQHGKAVLCEKPLGMHPKEVKELYAIAKKNNTLLMEGMWTTFLPNFQKLKKIVTNNQLGKVTNAHIDFCFSAPNNPNHRLINKSLGGGTVLDIGIYTIFSCLELFGVPKNINAKADIGPTGVDLACCIDFEYETFTAHLTTSFKKDSPTNISIEFEEGVVVLGPNFYAPSNLEITQNGKKTVFNKYPLGEGYQLEATHFQEVYKNKQLESPVWSSQKSIQLAAYLAAVLNKINVSYEV